MKIQSIVSVNFPLHFFEAKNFVFNVNERKNLISNRNSKNKTLTLRKALWLSLRKKLLLQRSEVHV